VPADARAHTTSAGAEGRVWETMTVVVLGEASDQLDPSASARDLHRSTEAARIAGCHAYHIPQGFSVCETADNALWHVPEHETVTPAVWIGYIPTPERYEAIYEAARTKGIRPLNTPDEQLSENRIYTNRPESLLMTVSSSVIAAAAE
jgi:hypothetical protein